MRLLFYEINFFQSIHVFIHVRRKIIYYKGAIPKQHSPQIKQRHRTSKALYG